MPHKTKLAKRQSIRLPSYDYSTPADYFITLCVARNTPLFGDVINQQLTLTAAGCMIDNHWRALPQRFPTICLDSYVIMPDHFHGIISLYSSASIQQKTSLSTIIGIFKSLTTYAYKEGMKHYQWPSCLSCLWQRNYYEHIIRNENDLNSIRAYIDDNPHALIQKINNNRQRFNL